MRTLLLCALLAGTAQAQTSTVQELYSWYLRQPHHFRSFAPVRGLFEPGLYTQLERVWGYKFTLPGPPLLDFDPLLGGQMGAESFQVVSQQVEGDKASVIIRLKGFRNSTYQQGVRLVRSGGRWLVTDWYTPGSQGGVSSTRKIFAEIDAEAAQARQSKQPDWAAKGLLTSYLARTNWEQWYETNRGRFTFAAQEALEKRSAEPDPLLGGLTGQVRVSKASVTGTKASVAASVGGQPVTVELEKDEFGWRVTGVTR